MALQNDTEFVQNLKEFLSLEKKIDDFKSALKKLEIRKKTLYEKVHKKMIIKKVETLKLPNGSKIKNYIRKSKEYINKPYIEKRLNIYCNENQIDYEKLHDFIYNDKYRSITEKPAITKTRCYKKK
jgi:hypothetical protein